MTLVSKVRLGAVAGLINVKPETVDELMISMQPATINAAAGQNLDSRERDIERAKQVRQRL